MKKETEGTVKRPDLTAKIRQAMEALEGEEFILEIPLDMDEDGGEADAGEETV